MKRGGKTAHVIEVLTGDTPEAYRAYLRRNGISYIQAGDHELDCRAAQFQLKEVKQLEGGVLWLRYQVKGDS